MLKYLLGPVLMGAGYLAGSVYGRDAEQLVHKSPSATYAAVEEALSGVSESGTTRFDGGTPMPYELKIDRTPDQQLLLTLSFNGRQGASADLQFTPMNDGKDTLVVAHMHGDHSVLRTALAGTDKAKLAYAPDWMLNLTARPLLKQLAEQIEAGQLAHIAGLTQADVEDRWEQQLTPEQRQDLGEWRQYDATRPAVDPDADAQNAIGGENR